MDLIEFLRVRLDQDEAAARAATEAPWNARTLGRHDGGAVVRSQSTIGIHGARASADALYIARWDPARVLAEVEAKRRILERAEGIHTFGDMRAWSSMEEVLTALAQPYADHPDFDPAWLLTPA